MNGYRRKAARRTARERTASARNGARAALAFAAAAALAGVCVAGAHAYLSDADSAENRFTVASTSIEIVETFPDDPPVIEEGSVEKTVTVTNTGTGPCYVRAIVELSDSAAEAYASFSVNTEAWTEKQPDGYHYYRSPLPVGASTNPLITAVDIGAAPPDGYRDFDVVVHAESAQAKDPATGKDYPDGQSAFAAIAAA